MHVKDTVAAKDTKRRITDFLLSRDPHAESLLEIYFHLKDEHGITINAFYLKRLMDELVDAQDVYQDERGHYRIEE